MPDELMVFEDDSLEGIFDEAFITGNVKEKVVP